MSPEARAARAPAAGERLPDEDREAVCPNCGARGLAVFYRQPRVPVQSVLLLDDAETARAFPRAEIRLGLCGACGFVTNTRFDPALQEFSARYEETQGFSPRFRQFATGLATGWVERHGLHGKTVLEIGCGKGEFLALMCEVSGGRGIGFDPAYVEGRLDSPARARIEFVADRFTEETQVTADAIVCRHTLEHIPDTRRFVRMVRRAIGGDLDTVVLFEVPDMTRVLRDVCFWDVFYEHCSYFTAGSLARVFREAGFEILDVRLEYDGQYLIVEARPTRDGAPGRRTFSIEPSVEETRAAAEGFARVFARRVEEWGARISEATDRGGRVVCWGSGSKATGFLTTLGLDHLIDAVVDINPMRHGTYVAGTGHEIVAPERLRDIRPTLVVAMNPIYCDEIRAELARIAVEADVVGLSPLGNGGV